MSDTAKRPLPFRGRSLAWLTVCGVFVGVSLLSVPVPGINEPHYFAKARAFADPTWCDRDFFLQSANGHYVFFTLVGPLTAWLPPAAAAVAGRILSLSLLACGWMMLGRRLRLSSGGIALSACAFCGIAMSGNFSGEWILGGFEGKVPAYAFALMAVAVWVDAWTSGRTLLYVGSGMLMGLAVALHPVVGLWFCVCMAAAELACQIVVRVRPGMTPDADRRHWSAFVFRGSAFAGASFLLSLPGLVPALRMVLSAGVEPARLDEANFIQVYSRLAHHLDPATFSQRAWIHTGVVMVVCMYSILSWRLLRDGRNTPDETGDKGSDADVSASAWLLLITLLVAAAIVAAAGVLIGWHTVPAEQLPDWQWRAALLKFYPFRLFDALLPIITAFAGVRLLDVLVVRRPAWGRMTVVAALATCMFGAAMKRPEAPSGYSPEQLAAWRDACAWFRSQTPPDVLVLAPRESFAFKWYAERAEYVCYKDCPQDAAGILEWNRRLWLIHGWAKYTYTDKLFSRTDTQRLHEETGVTHLLTRQLGPFEQQPVYQNDIWRVYETVPPE